MHFLTLGPAPFCAKNAAKGNDPNASLFAYRPKRGLSFLLQQLPPQGYP